MDSQNCKKVVLNYEPFKIEAGKVREFSCAIGSTNPIYFDHEKAIQAGYRTIVAPPTFYTVVDYWNKRDFYKLFDLLKLNPTNVLHGEQSYQYFHDVYDGDTITSQLVVLNQIEKKGKIFYKLETTYKNQQGLIVAVGKATLIQVLEVVN